MKRKDQERRASSGGWVEEKRWAAAPLADVALLYRLVVERAGPGVTVYHAVQEEGVALREGAGGVA
jgi:hypothetical protein